MEPSEDGPFFPSLGIEIFVIGIRDCREANTLDLFHVRYEAMIFSVFLGVSYEDCSHEDVIHCTQIPLCS